MRGVQNLYHPHSYVFPFFVFSVLILFFPPLSISVNTLSSTESLTISSNRTIVSPGDIFELGFFKPSSRPRWYLGIWCKKVPQRAYLWVANRDNPLSNSMGTLKISDSNLVLLDQSDKLIWSTNQTGDKRSTVVAELFDNGNFVLRDSDNRKSSDGFSWQSFDFPTNTLLPQMKLGCDLRTGLNRILRSWKSEDDPSSGYYSYKLETRGVPEFFLSNRGSPVHRSGPWDGLRFSGIPELEMNYMVYNFTDTREEVAYTFLMTNNSIHSILTLSTKGTLDRFTWIPTSFQWNLIWSSPKEGCDMYKMCGPYSYCDINTSPLCNCIRGFDPMNQQQWDLTDGTDGCVRRTPLSCRGDKFWQMKKMKLPDTTAAIVDRNIGLKDCRERCLKDCNCTAFANTDVRKGGFGCIIWNRELLDIRNYAGGQDLYVRLASSDIGEERKIRGKIIVLIVGVILMLFFSFILFCFWKRKQKRGRTTIAPNVETVHQDRNQALAINEVIISRRRHFSGENNTEDSELPLMEFEAIVMATDNFSDSNKIGKGGFGIVYKGNLPDGQEIAVKRLSKTSTQGVNEFMNEVKLIARLQHINLVRLLGCCVGSDEKMLIYEYLENLSLDAYLFDKTQSSKLDWRKRFEIINGIARGILYLHQDSRFRIIHRDLKASNVLLDKDMTPKISDFGMARIFGRDETEANTRMVVGTYGYMSPEYAMDGIFSLKSDVFSFGVLLLEIISGKRNKGFYNSNNDLNLLAFVWRHWKEAKGFEIVDPVIMDSSSSSLSTFRPHEVLRCIQIGLLCVQERAEDRPTMSSVVMMLGSETEAIPQPKPPGYCVGRSPLETDSQLSNQPDEEFLTVNQITISVINGR